VKIGIVGPVRYAHGRAASNVTLEQLREAAS
jgi:hypothetical protein